MTRKASFCDLYFPELCTHGFMWTYVKPRLSLLLTDSTVSALPEPRTSPMRRTHFSATKIHPTAHWHGHFKHDTKALRGHLPVMSTRGTSSGWQMHPLATTSPSFWWTNTKYGLTSARQGNVITTHLSGLCPWPLQCIFQRLRWRIQWGTTNRVPVCMLFVPWQLSPQRSPVFSQLRGRTWIPFTQRWRDTKVKETERRPSCSPKRRTNTGVWMRKRKRGVGGRRDVGVLEFRAGSGTE